MEVSSSADKSRSLDTNFMSRLSSSQKMLVKCVRAFKSSGLLLVELTLVQELLFKL